MIKIGAITVGQSPRTDLMPDMEKILMDSIEVIQMGGLDGLSRKEIETMTPAGPEDHVLVSRLRDGSSVTFGESYILPRMQNCIYELEKQGVSLIIFLCTGEFPDDFQSNVPLIFPNNIMIGTVPAVMPGCRLAVMTPAAEQTEQVTRKWMRAGASAVQIYPVSPYNGLQDVLNMAETISIYEHYINYSVVKEGDVITYLPNGKLYLITKIEHNTYYMISDDMTTKSVEYKNGGKMPIKDFTKMESGITHGGEQTIKKH